MGSNIGSIKKGKGAIRVCAAALTAAVFFVLAGTGCGDLDHVTAGGDKYVDENGGGQGSEQFRDSRDGQNYRTVRVGSLLLWMAENLNYETDDSWCYDDDPANCELYGRLYTWEAAMSACPAGWRLPHNRDWNNLIQSTGGTNSGAIDLKAQTGWNENGNGSDTFGFAALPGGARVLNRDPDRDPDNDPTHIFHNIGEYGHWWSATESSLSDVWTRNIYFATDYIDEYFDLKSNAFSVRCVRDARL